MYAWLDAMVRSLPTKPKVLGSMQPLQKCRDITCLGYSFLDPHSCGSYQPTSTSSVLNVCML